MYKFFSHNLFWSRLNHFKTMAKNETPIPFVILLILLTNTHPQKPIQLLLVPILYIGQFLI